MYAPSSFVSECFLLSSVCLAPTFIWMAPYFHLNGALLSSEWPYFHMNGPTFIKMTLLSSEWIPTFIWMSLLLNGPTFIWMVFFEHLVLGVLFYLFHSSTHFPFCPLPFKKIILWFMMMKYFIISCDKFCWIDFSPKCCMFACCCIIPCCAAIYGKLGAWMC